MRRAFARFFATLFSVILLCLFMIYTRPTPKFTAAPTFGTATPGAQQVNVSSYTINYSVPNPCANAWTGIPLLRFNNGNTISSVTDNLGGSLNAITGTAGATGIQAFSKTGFAVGAHVLTVNHSVSTGNAASMGIVLVACGVNQASPENAFGGTVLTTTSTPSVSITPVGSSLAFSFLSGPSGAAIFAGTGTGWTFGAQVVSGSSVSSDWKAISSADSDSWSTASSGWVTWAVSLSGVPANVPRRHGTIWE